MSRGTPATFGQRLIAILIDGGIILAAFIPTLIVVLILGQISSALGILAAIGLYLLVFAAAAYMYIGGIGSTGQTPGKRMQGVQVVSDDGGMIGMGGAAVRYILYAISNSIVCGLPVGSLWMLFDAEKKTLYDKVLNYQAIQVEPGGLLPIFPEGNPI
jgi:uncharacterized RDD family membrane protein YckC